MSAIHVTVVLPHCSENQSALRSELSSVLQRAGMTVIPAEKDFNSNSDLTIAGQLPTSDCSVHIIFPEYAPLVSTYTSFAKLQFQEAKAYLNTHPDFKIFVWMPPSTDLMTAEPLQLNFINEVKNNISKNMVSQ